MILLVLDVRKPIITVLSLDFLLNFCCGSFGTLFAPNHATYCLETMTHPEYLMHFNSQSAHFTGCPLDSVQDRLIEVPAKSTFSRQLVVKLYDVTRTGVMDELKNSVDFYTATTDMWSSYGMMPYIGFTLHWIDDQWNLQNRCQGTKYVPEAHTADVKIRLKIWYFFNTATAYLQPYGHNHNTEQI